jgi:protein involved in ribonucleotide reduction
VEKLNGANSRIPIDTSNSSDLVVRSEYVLFVPTYGGGSERTAIPRQVRFFLNIKENRKLLRGVVGMGNRNFGEHYCKAAEIISKKVGVPLIAKVEIFGTQDDVNTVYERLNSLYGQEL